MKESKSSRLHPALHRYLGVMSDYNLAVLGGVRHDTVAFLRESKGIPKKPRGAPEPAIELQAEVLAEIKTYNKARRKQQRAQFNNLDWSFHKMILARRLAERRHQTTISEQLLAQGDDNSTDC